VTRALLLALILSAGPAGAASLGGHGEPAEEPAATPVSSARRGTLQEMWRRRILPADQTAWSPADEELLRDIREAEPKALDLLRRTFGGYGPWAVRVHRAGRLPVILLTVRGYDKYREVLTQDAIAYFTAKGAEAKWVFKLKDWDGKPMFDGNGLLTPAGERVYRLARDNRKVFWRDGAGQLYGTRRPPSAQSAVPPPETLTPRRVRRRSRIPRPAPAGPAPKGAPAPAPAGAAPGKSAPTGKS
jgi:hypothetical protein